ncbi:MBL fold metallo-hydrolase [Rhodococcus chondri]|uniref:MBL fold metallo-hydrolase n=1 Tax=Rhodococcus chondri TaxID=3065941 RepID=A0ABU7JMZ6_9NOCA|nr:MBL fold metallo-hydrolase [Rhodococcus sp. CC-R104]MEE2031180.1 MBL fold metallo-hydrolase [Rhodococcus sp. CC-R104]
MFARDVAPGVHRIAHADVNVYLVEDDDGVTVVDSGFPATFAHVERGLQNIGRRTDDVRAVVLTHAHFDHVGSARRMRRRWQVPIRAHRDERFLAAHPYRYKHERNRLIYPVRYPACIPVMARMVVAGALGVRGVDEVTLFDGGECLDVPGDPLVLHTPGHTFGHCALYLPDRDTVIAGDAIVTLDPYTAARGPQIVSGAATADSAAALASLSAIADTGATHLLPGHGEPWHGGAAAAVELALRAGPS